MPALTLKVFISSPSDVVQERMEAIRVLERLEGEFGGAVELPPILWEREPLRATADFAKQIPPTSAADVVICILWSRLGTILPEQYGRGDGAPPPTGTEWEFEDAIRSYEACGKPELLVYRKTAEPFTSISDVKEALARIQQKQSLDAFLDRWFGNPHSSFKRAFHPFETLDQYVDLLETHLRRLIEDRLPEHHTTEGEETGRKIVYFGPPYRGLAPFDLEHAPIFSGRTRAIGEIRQALVRQVERGCTFLLIFGMSGGGKSSLVRAGLLPTLTHPGVVEGIDVWRRCIFRPSDTTADLFEGLALALLGVGALPELWADALEPSQLAKLLRTAPERTVTFIQMGLKRAAEAAANPERSDGLPEARLLVVVDQLEELFTLERIDATERAGFVAVLSALARSGLVWVIATMRSDFYPRCREIPELVALKEETGQYDLLPPTPGEIAQMIRYPARAAGLRFESDPITGERLDDILHGAAARDPEALPLLEFTLDELFKRRSTQGGILTFAAYRQLGGLEGALAQTAERVLTSLESRVQAALPALLRDLVILGEGDTRLVAARRVTLTSLAPGEECQALLTAFLEARLLVTDLADNGQVVVGVAHEALLRHWPRVQRWLAEDQEFLQARKRVAEAAHQWQEEKQRPDLLLPAGKPLADAADMLDSRRADLDAGVVRFIEASRRKVALAQRTKIGLVAVFFGLVLGFALFSDSQRRTTERLRRTTERQKENTLNAVARLTELADDFPVPLLDLPGAIPVLVKSYQDNLKLIQNMGGTRAAKQVEAANLHRLGDIYLRQGKVDMARTAYERALKIGLELVAGTHDPRDRVNLGVYWDKIGDLREQEGKLPAAREAYEKSLAVQREVAEGKDKEYAAAARKHLSARYVKVGDLRLDLGDRSGAAQAYERGLAIALELARDKANSQARWDLAAAHQRMGDLRQEQGDIPGARKAYEQSLAIARELARDKRNAQAQKYLASAYQKMGQIHLKQGEMPQALSCCRRCLQIERELARDAADAAAPSRLAAAYGDLAYAELFGDDPKAAIAHATRALQLDRNQPRIALTLAHAYLFDNQYGNAQTCYRMMLKQDAADGGRSVAEMIREDFQQLRKHGRTHPDMARIEKLPAQTPLPAVPSASPKV